MRGSRRKFLGWIGAAIATAAAAPIAQALEAVAPPARERRTVYGLGVFEFGEGVTIEFSGFTSPGSNGRFSVIEHCADGGLVLERVV